MAKGKAKKVNPRRKPVSEADLNRAKATASDQAFKLTVVIFLTVLMDNFGFDKDQLHFAWERLNKLSGEVAERRISAWDLAEVLKDEYDVDVGWRR